MRMRFILQIPFKNKQDFKPTVLGVGTRAQHNAWGEMITSVC